MEENYVVYVRPAQAVLDGVRTASNCIASQFLKINSPSLPARRNAAGIRSARALAPLDAGECAGREDMPTDVCVELIDVVDGGAGRDLVVERE